MLDSVNQMRRYDKFCVTWLIPWIVFSMKQEEMPRVMLFLIQYFLPLTCNMMVGGIRPLNRRSPRRGSRNHWTILMSRILQEAQQLLSTFLQNESLTSTLTTTIPVSSTYSTQYRRFSRTLQACTQYIFCVQYSNHAATSTFIIVPVRTDNTTGS